MNLFLGQRAWMLQRASALVLLLFVALGGARLLFGAPLDYAQWRAIADSAYGAALIVVFFAALCLHAWIGVRDVVLDYVKPLAVRLPLLGAIAVILAAVLARVVLTLAAQFVGG
jgi:succinate dehydrogenase / fumarate reductase membrane anchor subunit